MKTISIIAAVAQNNALGYKNQLLYHLPDDLNEKYQQYSTLRFCQILLFFVKLSICAL